ncbi:MAG: DUF1800 domain-containing protein [Candidatus Hydrogenedentes bacterium]|nr:DUF1800 domain-containing protein [Candidatus Hydrogenedentota bacterium]
MATLRPLQASAWGQAHARHLLNRAGFGVSQALVELLADLGLEDAVHYLVDYERQESAVEAPGFLLPPQQLQSQRREYAGASEEERRKLRQQLQREERENIQQLKEWWLARMVHTPRPLEEKLTLFWHGHFATSSQKVRSSYHTYQLNRLFREQASGNFKQLTAAVGQSAAMLNYLDNARSTKEDPNENWARELMELFTLGQGQYNEDDIKESARAFTGWSHDMQEFTYRIENHDFGEKTFMGRSGPLDGWDVLDIIFEQPAASPFIAGKLWRYLAHEQAVPALTYELGHVLRHNGFELKPMLTTLFLSEAFYAPEVMGGQIKSPVQLLVQLCDDLGLENMPYEQMARATAALGQDLFYPPNVKGWDGNRAWINANTLLQRYNLPPRLAMASLAPARQEMLETSQAMMAPGTDPELAPRNRNRAQSTRGAGRGRPNSRAVKELLQQQREQVAEKLRLMPRAERRTKIRVLKQGTPEQRAEMLRALGIRPLPWQEGAMEIFAELNFDTGRECIAALEGRFLVRPLNDDQRRILQEALGITEPSARLRLAEVPVDRRRAALHLITSLAEYQLC